MWLIDQEMTLNRKCLYSCKIQSSKMVDIKNGLYDIVKAVLCAKMCNFRTIFWMICGFSPIC